MTAFSRGIATLDKIGSSANCCIFSICNFEDASSSFSLLTGDPNGARRLPPRFDSRVFLVISSCHCFAAWNNSRIRKETSEKSSARSSVSGGSLSNKLTRTPHGTREPSSLSVPSVVPEEYVASSRYRKGYENVLVYSTKKNIHCQKHTE